MVDIIKGPGKVQNDDARLIYVFHGLRELFDKQDCRWEVRMQVRVEVDICAADFGLQDICSRVYNEKSFHDFVHLYT